MINRIYASKYLSVIITISLFVLAFLAGSILYTGFFSLQVLLNLFIDNAFLIIAATGMTFVILTGGIDLSVGSIVALTSMVTASLLEKQVNPVLVILIVIFMGLTAGLLMGLLIQYFKIQPFIATLAGMFLFRGLCYLISVQSIAITDDSFQRLANIKIYFPGGSYISINVIVSIIVLLFGIYFAHYTKFGRNVYAIGGNEESAKLMGLPVARTKVLVYVLNGFCASLAGLVLTLYMLSGYGLHANDLHMDAIASVVIGGTLLTGGSGYVLGSLFGVLVQGLIQTIIMFQGTLSSWWTKIFVGLLLFIFILIQRLVTARKEKQHNSNSINIKTKKETVIK